MMGGKPRREPSKVDLANTIKRLRLARVDLQEEIAELTDKLYRKDRWETHLATNAVADSFEKRTLMDVVRESAKETCEREDGGCNSENARCHICLAKRALAMVEAAKP